MWIRGEQLVGFRPCTLCVICFITNDRVACSITEEMENMRSGVTSESMHVVAKPAFPIPNSFKCVQHWWWGSGLVSLLQEGGKLAVKRTE